jgi:hypothetical protein
MARKTRKRRNLKRKSLRRKIMHRIRGGKDCNEIRIEFENKKVNLENQTANTIDEFIGSFKTLYQEAKRSGCDKNFLNEIEAFENGPEVMSVSNKLLKNSNMSNSMNIDGGKRSTRKRSTRKRSTKKQHKTIKRHNKYYHKKHRRNGGGNNTNINPCIQYNNDFTQLKNKFDIVIADDTLSNEEKGGEIATVANKYEELFEKAKDICPELIEKMVQFNTVTLGPKMKKYARYIH